MFPSFFSLKLQTRFTFSHVHLLLWSQGETHSMKSLRENEIRVKMEKRKEAKKLDLYAEITSTTLNLFMSIFEMKTFLLNSLCVKEFVIIL